jgi:hypothetical protein
MLCNIILQKQEQLDIEQGSHSPNDDSGISPGHGSSGSSAGPPSPGQSGPYGSPEHFSVQENQAMKSEPNTELNALSQLPRNQQVTSQNTVPIWEINLLKNSHSQSIVPQSLKAVSNLNIRSSILKSASQTTMSEPDHQQQNKSPSETQITEDPTPSTSPLHSFNSLATPVANRNQNDVSPNHSAQSHIFDSPVRISSHNNMKTSPMHAINATPVSNTGSSDDNSRSSSSSTMMQDGVRENYKMTLHEGEQSPLRCLEMTVEQSSVMGGMKAGVPSGPGAGNNAVRNVYQCPLCDYTTLSR